MLAVLEAALSRPSPGFNGDVAFLSAARWPEYRDAVVGTRASPLTMKVVPYVAVAPATVWIRADVAPDAANRLLDVVAESPGYYRSSQMPLNGNGAPRVTTIEFHDLPAGEYWCSVTLTTANGHLTVVKQMVTVV
jgi:hypothetical protein